MSFIVETKKKWRVKMVLYTSTRDNYVKNLMTVLPIHKKHHDISFPLAMFPPGSAILFVTTIHLLRTRKRHGGKNTKNHPNSSSGNVNLTQCFDCLHPSLSLSLYRRFDSFED